MVALPSIVEDAYAQIIEYSLLVSIPRIRAVLVQNTSVSVFSEPVVGPVAVVKVKFFLVVRLFVSCLLYTSDAADE